MTDSPDLVVDDQLCFALYTASQAFGACYRSALAATGLTYSQYLVMMVLWEHDRTASDEPGSDEAGVSLKTLCERLQLDNGTLSPLVKRLEQHGLVVRSRSRTDERVLQIACSPRGRSLYQRAVAAQREVGEATGLSGAEVAALRDTLQTLAARMRTTAPEERAS
jgi:MarR family transcriptional regulator, organic hydroperoxide resistance regulator